MSQAIGGNSAASGANAIEIQGRPVSPAAPTGGEVLVWNSVNADWEPGVAGSSGGVAGQTTFWTTPALGTGGIANGVISIAKTFTMINIQVSSAARVRLYSTSALSMADALRSNQVPPTPGTSNGVICDFYLDTAAKFNWIPSPAPLGFNWDVSQSTAVYYNVTNLGNTNTAVTTTVTYVPMQV